MLFLCARSHLHSRAQCGAEGGLIYIGDGATVTQSSIRKRGKALISHSPVRTQLTWCQKEGVPRAIVTHCGSEIVTGDEREISAEIRAMAAERHVDVRIAYDGMKLTLLCACVWTHRFHVEHTSRKLQPSPCGRRIQ